MSERISTRDDLGHVPKQKSLPKRTHGDIQAPNRATRQAQQKEVSPVVSLPDMPQISPDEQVSDDLEAYRELAIEILNLAIEDVDIRADYETEANRTAAERNRASAISFFKGEWFKDICEGIGIPHSSAKKAAFK